MPHILQSGLKQSPFHTFHQQIITLLSFSFSSVSRSHNPKTSCVTYNLQSNPAEPLLAKISIQDNLSNLQLFSLVTF